MLLLCFFCAAVILKLIILQCCSRALNSNGFALPALRIKHSLQAAIRNRHGFRTRLQNVAMGVSQPVSLGSLGDTKRYTHTMVSTPSSCRRHDPNATCSALAGLWYTMPDRQTLPVCSEIVRRSLKRLCRSSFPDASCCENVSKRKLKSFEPSCFWLTQVIVRPSGPVHCHQTQPT